jgi:uncharacterized membrane protein
MKVARIIAGFILIFGVVLIVGAVGTSDYMDEIGQYYPLTETMKTMGVGLILMVPYWIIRAIDDTFEIHIRIYRKER